MSPDPLIMFLVVEFHFDCEAHPGTSPLLGWLSFSGIHTSTAKGDDDYDHDYDYVLRITYFVVYYVLYITTTGMTTAMSNVQCPFV